ncbi:DNA-directed RNA polymerase II subunit D [Puccinia sorghi]|uniref:DNA-directed RNA polymerase II subunit D n=1 Tax=Puccinia sorghi TaxID=27349 RepID=A0A0L6VPS3_9BASI|nr:DNA-directed RNA polymerase II subunit D [Puccinia sorghi]
MALRRGRIQEEDASQLKLGKDVGSIIIIMTRSISDFDMAGCLSISEVKLLLEQRAQPADTASVKVYKKTHEYVNQFARFNSTDSAQAARQILSKDTNLKPFELAQLASLCPEEAEEAKSLIPRRVVCSCVQSLFFTSPAPPPNPDKREDTLNYSSEFQVKLMPGFLMTMHYKHSSTKFPALSGIKDSLQNMAIGTSNHPKTAFNALCPIAVI